MLLLKIFEFTKDNKVKLCKKILLNDKVEYQFHPSVISTYQDKNNLYFYQVFHNKLTNEQTVMLRSFNLLTSKLELHESDIFTDAQRGGKLVLSVGFFKKPRHDPCQKENFEFESFDRK